MNTNKRRLYARRSIKELKEKISVREKQIEFLTRENRHLSDSNNELNKKVNELCKKFDQVSIEYSDKLIELDRVISGYNAAKRSLNCIKLEYEKKVKSLLDELY